MNWKRILLVIIILAILIPLGLYLSALDWSRSHTKATSQLPLLKISSEDGLYRLPINDLEFRVRTTGMQNDGDPVILLHGFPESSLMWQPLMDSLSDNGFKVLAFDQRGYSPGARPKEVGNYTIPHLVGDVLDIANAVQFDTFHLVGHDWGSIVGWNTVMDHYHRIHSWTALSIPHPQVFSDAVVNHPIQSERSGYIKSLQRSLIPEFLFGVFNKRAFNALEDRWTSEQIEEIKGMLSEPGAMTAALNWYRAMDVEEALEKGIYKKDIHVPTLFILGQEDEYVAAEIVPNQEPYMKASYSILQLNCGHSIIQEAPKQTISSITAHVSAGANR